MIERGGTDGEYVRALAWRSRRSRPGFVGVARWQVEPSGEALPEVRAAVRQRAQVWGLDEDDTHALLLVVIELATNAIEHARTRCLVVVRRLGSAVRVIVTDGSTAPPVIQVHDVHAVRGRGLQMVQALAVRWGWTRITGGKAVWASLPVSGGPTLVSDTADRSPADDQENSSDAPRQHRWHRRGSACW